MKPGKQEHFRQLYDSVHVTFERFCRARVYGEMDYRDLMNETLLVAWEKLDTLRSEKAFLGFLFGIAVRLLARNHRKKRELKTEDQPLLKERPSGESADRDAEIHLLYKALARLPEIQREALILFEINGFSIKEIAGMQEASQAAVKKRLERGRKQLYQLLRETPQVGSQSMEVNHG
ncbi:MAG: RNA polymerase sigma factor [Salibacteraceae bacterium]